MEFENYINEIKRHSRETIKLASIPYSVNCLLKFSLQCMFYMQMYKELYNYSPNGIVLIASPVATFAEHLAFAKYTNPHTKDPLQLLHMKYNFFDRCVKYRGFSMTIGIKGVHETCVHFKRFFTSKFINQYHVKINQEQSICILNERDAEKTLEGCYGLFIGSEKQVKRIIADSNKHKLGKLKRFLPIDNTTSLSGFFIFYKIFRHSRLVWKRLKIKI